ncbi:MAG: AsmA-like C-terminal domain-containing protein [Syntrophorhabdus sp.]
MKKIIAISLACLVLVILAIMIVSSNLPAVISHMLSRAGVPVKIEKADFSFSDGTISVELGDIRLKGPVTGKIGQVSARMYFSRGIFFENIAMKDFDVAINEIKPAKRDLSIRVGLLEINNGIVNAAGRKLVIGSIVAQNINTTKPVQFVASISDPDHGGKIRVVGNSTIQSNKHRVKGSVEVDSFGLEKFDSILSGVVNGKGEFIYYDGALTLSGKCNSPRLVLQDTWLVKPLIVDKVTARSTITLKDSLVNIAVYDTGYEKTPFTINVQMMGFVFSRLDINSGFIPMKTVREYVKVDSIGYDVWTYIKDGYLKMKRLTYEKDKPLITQLELKDVTGEYEGKELTDISGFLNTDESRGTFSDGRGFFKASSFYGINGTIDFGKKPRIRLAGKYMVNLEHIPYFVDLKDIKINKGTAEGTIELDSAKEKDLKLGGAGKINNAEVEWRKQSFVVSGPFQLSGQELTFNPASVLGKDTALSLNGNLSPAGFNCMVKGYLDSGILAVMTGKSYNVSGKAQVNTHVMVHDGQVSTNGMIGMDDIAYSISGFLKKTRGVPSKAQVRLTRKKSGDIAVDEFNGNLDIINVLASGTISREGKIDSKVSLRAKDTGHAASLFVMGEDIKGGDVAIDLTVKDLIFPITKLPWVVGTASMRKGFMKLPGMPKMMKNIDLTADFRGHEFDVVINGLTTGTSVVRKASLKVNGFENPKFDCLVSMDRLNTADFKGPGAFKIQSIAKDSVLARSSGKLSIRAKDIEFGKVPAKDLEISAFMTDRKINVSDLKLRIFGGDTDIKGMIDLSGPVPSLYANGRMNRVKSGVFFAAMGGTSQELSGEAFINGTLKTEGQTTKELKANLNGDTAVYSKDGVIKRWNLLSKVFALLNVYDLVRGKIDFGKDGLAYKKMGASFVVNRGVCHTKNFLLDSQSMIITGSGDIDLNKETINGTLEVSPLIALDRTIDKIPIIRSILKNKNKGFLYVTYSVTGPFDDPDITTNYVGTVGTKTLEILRNIIVFPKEVFEKK